MYLQLLREGYENAEKVYGYDLANEKHYLEELEKEIRKLR